MIRINFFYNIIANLCKNTGITFNCLLNIENYIFINDIKVKY